VDLDTAADELYAVSPDDFTVRRQQLVADARKEGNREVATQIGKLRRPTRSAWLINLLSRDGADNIDALFELGVALQQAQQRMAGDEPAPTFCGTSQECRRHGTPCSRVGPSAGVRRTGWSVAGGQPNVADSAG
jgi:hypothetical protein